MKAQRGWLQNDKMTRNSSDFLLSTQKLTVQLRMLTLCPSTNFRWLAYTLCTFFFFFCSILSHCSTRLRLFTPKLCITLVIYEGFLCKWKNFSINFGKGEDEMKDRGQTIKKLTGERWSKNWIGERKEWFGVAGWSVQKGKYRATFALKYNSGGSHACILSDSLACDFSYLALLRVGLHLYEIGGMKWRNWGKKHNFPETRRRGGGGAEGQGCVSDKNFLTSL